MNRLWEGASAAELAADLVCAVAVLPLAWGAFVVAFCV